MKLEWFSSRLMEAAAEGDLVPQRQHFSVFVDELILS